MRRVVATLVSTAFAVGAAACGGGSEGDASDDGKSLVEVASGQCNTGVGRASMYRFWNDVALDSIRLDFPAPTVHARNLFHMSEASYAAWSAFGETDAGLQGVGERAATDDVEAARNDAIAFAAHGLLMHRYQLSLARPETTLALNNALNIACGVTDADEFVAENPDSAAALGTDIAADLIASTLDDGALERKAYEDTSYSPVNPALEVAKSGAELVDPDRWQPLLLEVALSQNGLPLPGGEQTFIGSNWGNVRGFAVSDGPSNGGATPAGVTDPGPPPRIADSATADQYRSEAIDVIRASAELEVGAATLDIGPGAFGRNPLGTDDGVGHAENPATGEPYEANVVDAADYYRAIAEYWADGPTSETPPGHWNTLANLVSDSLDDGQFVVAGEGEPIDRLEWDVKLGLTLNGAMHDAAISGWGVKAFYDSVRPISMIRWMGGNGAFDAATNPTGLPLEAGLVEEVTAASSMAGERHEGLSDHVGEIAIRAWTGSPDDPETETAGVGWILAVDWVPYQRATFVTPAFASYVSGHSVFSRAGAEVLAGFTGSEYFPGGILTHAVPAGTLLHEEGPSETLTLNWATYFDASDEAGRSRIWGGIHIRADDEAGRRLGSELGQAALERALVMFGR